MSIEKCKQVDRNLKTNWLQTKDRRLSNQVPRNQQEQCATFEAKERDRAKHCQFLLPKIMGIPTN